MNIYISIFLIIFITLILIIYNKDKYIKSFPYAISNNFDIRNFVVNTPLSSLKAPLKMYTLKEKLPNIFIYNPKYISPVRDQKDCGACWAFVITSMLSDDITIRIINFGKNLSVQELINCYPDTNGCEGENPEDVLLWLEKSGFRISINDEYDAIDKGRNLCPQMAKIGIPIKKDSVVSLCEYIEEESTNDKKILPIIEKNILNMKNYIVENGPIYATISVYDDFFDFSGIVPYKKKNDNFIGGHAVEIIGWCDKGVDLREGYNEGYWVCKNSWGKNWASDYDFPGYFAIRMGYNECGIESRSGGASPDVKYLLRNKLTVGKLAFTDYGTLINRIQKYKRFGYT